MDSGGPKQAQVPSYSPGGVNVLIWEGTLAPPGEYDCTVRLRRQCGLMSNYFVHCCRMVCGDKCRLLFLSVMPSTKFGRLIECALLHTRAKIGEFCTSLLYGMPHRANLTKLRIIGCSKPIAAAVRCSLQNLELSAPSDSFDLSRKSH